MDTKTKKALDSHDSELRTVQELLIAHQKSLDNIVTALCVLNASNVRIERIVKNLPCATEPPDEHTPVEIPKRRLKVANQRA